MLTAINDALAAAAEKARREDAGDDTLRHFVDEKSAARFLEEHSITESNLFSEDLAPLHKWLQAIFLTDGSTIPIRPYHLGKVLGVPCEVAQAMLSKLELAARLPDIQRLRTRR